MTTIDASNIARTVIEMAMNDRFAYLEDLFAPRLREAVSAETVRDFWSAEISKRGSISTIKEPTIDQTKDGLVYVSVLISCENGGFKVFMSIDQKGLLNGLRFAPEAASWMPPYYADSKKFEEREVVVGDGPLSVTGTLSLPRGRGPSPGVVLLSGGGPFDRDETTGPNKPLKDLAWGLASHGVAVLRFDKVTYTHSRQIADLREFKMTDEYVPYAISAVRILQQQPIVDSARIFVLGHSMGGKVAPRIAAVEPSIAGLVIMAGDAQPMHKAAIRVVRYLASLHPSPSAEATVETIERQVALVDSTNLSPSTPGRDLPFGFPGSYWLEQREYDPVSTAAAIDKPMLILQGGRDYQVTVEDDLSLWKAGIEHKPNVSMRIYSADNHFFFSGSGPSSPAEYEHAQHVDPVVVADIAKWLTD